MSESADAAAAASTPPTASAKRFIFPRWANYALPAIAVGVLGGLVYVPVAIGLGFSPKALAVGYAPQQPVPYSHALHAGKLGIDCRYCHTTVEKAPFAALPPTQICMNCHTAIHNTSPRLEPIRQSWATGKPMEWVKVHDLPDYVYFNHSAHVNHGVGCASCHGRIDHMDVVEQVAPLSMGWCLDCHRAPENNLRPKDQVTNLAWRPTDHPLAKERNITDVAKAQELVGNELKKQYGIRDQAYMTSCFTCHR
ncbi:MAG TPA: cytochrome c3 family protein [Tepidisphaeraceae bacterium]|jgi:hypothetical protein